MKAMWGREHKSWKKRVSNQEEKTDKETNNLAKGKNEGQKSSMSFFTFLNLSFNTFERDIIFLAVRIPTCSVKNY